VIGTTTFLAALGVVVFASACVVAVAVLSAPADRCRCRCGAGKHAAAPTARRFDTHEAEAIQVGNSGRENRGKT
jgi:hypothetical protein